MSDNTKTNTPEPMAIPVKPAVKPTVASIVTPVKPVVKAAAAPVFKVKGWSDIVPGTSRTWDQQRILYNEEAI
jgi:hypothetical protein